ncbi:MAG: DRTGG domain-containing protein [Desulfobacterales bacterium]
MQLAEIKNELDAEFLCGTDRLDKNVSIAGGADLIDDILTLRTKGAVLLTGLSNADVIVAAKNAGIEAIVFVRGKRPEATVVAIAEKNDIPLLLTRFSLFVACGRLYMSGLRGLDGSW